MINKQEVLLRLVCAALQGGMSPNKIFNSLQETQEGDYNFYDIANIIYPEDFPYSEDEPVSTTKNTY